MVTDAMLHGLAGNLPDNPNELGQWMLGEPEDNDLDYTEGLRPTLLVVPAWMADDFVELMDRVEKEKKCPDR